MEYEEAPTQHLQQQKGSKLQLELEEELERHRQKYVFFIRIRKMEGQEIRFSTSKIQDQASNIGNISKALDSS